MNFAGISNSFFRSVIRNGSSALKLGTGYTPPADSNWYLYSNVYDDNPWSGAEWTWADINNLEAGIRIRNLVTWSGLCAQLWVVVNDPGWDIFDQYNSSVGNGTYRLTWDEFNETCTTYWWQVEVWDGENDVMSPIYHFNTTCPITPSANITNRTIRSYGTDYFTWLGGNESAFDVQRNITGFDETEEYLAIWNQSGEWWYYYGDGSGSNWSIHTFDVVFCYLNDSVGNLTFNMTMNNNIDYSAGRTVSLLKTGDGYNYTGYTNSMMTNLSTLNTTLALGIGYSVSVWNRTIFDWDTWISGFGPEEKNVFQYNVVLTKIEANKNWVM